MKITKYYRNGYSTKIEIEMIKDYGRFGLYQVYKVDGDNRTPLYKECFSNWDLRRIERHGLFLRGVYLV